MKEEFMGKKVRYEQTKELVLMSVFIAIIVIQAVIPFLGFIPIGAMNASLIQVTVAIGAILLGPKCGAGLGFTFGLVSIWKNTFMPNPTSFCFSPFVSTGGFHGDIRSLVISLIPRIGIGLGAWYVYHFFSKRGKQKIGLLVGGAIASLINTILVMGFIYLFFGRQYAHATNRAMEGMIVFIMGVIGTQGVLEAVVTAVITFGVVTSLLKARNHQ